MINIYSYTSEGPRSTNQDCILHTQIPDRGLLCCVADGVGGNQGGEIASKLATEVFERELTKPEVTLHDCAMIAHHDILKKASADGKLLGMATTVTAVLINGYSLAGINCGDSRTYLLRDNGLMQLSQDHSEVARLLASGKLTKESAVDYPRRHILESALGAHKPLTIQEFKYDLKDRDRIILISDGVYSVLSKKELRDLSVSNEAIEDFGEQVIKSVIAKKTADNFSILIVEI
ncbi:PP2C family protein-serine/threonine phosphatase [Pantoea vagans]|uniref:PP2C family protein-serine/threonine phosphatase n=1 Tax=Pantoea vagans TaxID=470934 RepID=UPI0023AF1175|nr:protein phosphatase 2C domain-containing protein [Pantoea vagans]MDE8559110.1 protein phosphatase 2C domain-containing protein [Pantoea vagans]MDE8579105.1 protein phosphatase 2C domain-containing protein [Pantoea vagans]